MSLPLIAVVGRPNVGKSTFINRVATTSKTIVDKVPGVTRDRNYIDSDWAGKYFTLIDTGGFDFGDDQPFATEITEQAIIAVEEADVIIFMVDAKSGLMPDDEDIAKILRKSNKPVLLAINKVDNTKWDGEKHEYYKLGLGDPFVISSLHGIGIGDLLDSAVKELPKSKETEEEEILSVAIIGRPNVGKSSIFNKLLGEDRVIVSDIPGTTRDSIDTIIEIDDRKMQFIDTAGLRRKGKITESPEYYSLVRALRSVDRADIALLVIDSFEGATEQDQRIAEMAESRGCGIIILLNKWDLVKDADVREKMLSELAYKMRFIEYAPVLKVSALTGKGTSRIFEAIETVESEYLKRVATPELNKLLLELKAEGFAPTKKGKKLRLSYATQVGVAPPTFIIFVNHPDLTKKNYHRYIKGKLRSAFEFIGCPIFIRFRKKPGAYTVTDKKI